MHAALAVVRVLIVAAHDQPPPAGFADQLAIQLAGVAEVRRGGALPAGPLPQRVDAAIALADAAGAAIAVWIEPSPANAGGRDVALYVVGRRRGRVLVHVFRVDGPPGPDTDRALALRVGELVDATLTGTSTAAAWLGAPSVRATPPAPRLRPVVELGVRATPALGAPDATAGVAAAAGIQSATAGLDGGAHGIETVVAFTADTGHARRTPDGDVATDDLRVAVGVRGWREFGALGLGGGLTAGVRAVRAAGHTPAGSAARTTVALPIAALGVDARWRLNSRIALRAAAGVDYSPVRELLTVNGAPVMDLGRARPFATLAAVVSLR
ncbi:MAG: hypothetical protein D6689_05865 [Deltaproteobacteria bacterium]|nr:MAG: hypothetical protein D6689_05865 [Deltaproteobacteria bacterium]